MTIQQLRTNRKWRVFWFTLFFLLICIPLEIALFNVLYHAHEYWMKVFIYVTSLIIAVGLVGIIMHELPYSYEDVTAKKGRWFIEKEVALYQQLLKTSSPDTIEEVIDETNKRFRK